MTRNAKTGSGFNSVALTVVLVVASVPTLAGWGHSPAVLPDAPLDDWCFVDVVPPPVDEGGVLECFKDGTDKREIAWFDAEGDNDGSNDIAVFAVTADDTTLYLAATLFNDPDPDSLPMAQVALDIAPGGNTKWRDQDDAPPVGVFPTVLNNPFFGTQGNEPIGGDYLVVFDFANFVIGGPFNTEILEATTNPGSWTSLQFTNAEIFPGEVGGSGGDPGRVTIGIPFADLTCDGCPVLGPNTSFRFTFMMAGGDVAVPFFAPSSPLQDVISENFAGQYSNTVQSCPSDGTGTTCELIDISVSELGGSSDGFLGAGPPSGSVGGLMLLEEENGDLTASWDSSCLVSDTDYELYEGVLGLFTSHLPVACSTGGATTTTFQPSVLDDYYYLIVPANGRTSDGSYGQDSEDRERPTSSASCNVRVVGVCP